MFLSLLLSIFSCEIAAQHTADIRKIIELGYQKQTRQLLPYLTDKNEVRRYYATLQCISLADTLTIPYLKQNTTDTSLRVACTAAYALGGFSSEINLFLLPLILQEKRDTVAYWLSISSGKYAKTHQPLFYEYLDTLTKVTRLEGALYALSYLGMQGIYEEKGIQKALYCLFHTDKRLRYAASKYFERIPISQYTTSIRQGIFKQVQQETDIYTKIALIHALGKCLPNDSIQQYLNKICIEEKQEYRYIVAALRAGGIPTQKPAIQNEIIQQEMLNLVLNSHIPDTISYIKSFKTSLANAASSYPLLKNKSPYSALPLLMYLGQSVRNHAIIASEMLNTENTSIIRTTAANLLLHLRQDPLFHTLKQDTNLFLQYCKQGLLSKEVGVVSIMAGMARKYYLNQIDLSQLEQAKSSLILPRDIETYQEIEKTVAIKQGKKYSSSQYPQKYYTKIEWDLLSSLRPVVEIKTNKGILQAELYADYAPATVSYFLRLVKERYFEGRYFHRLVPNFVVQGGCPRGDGYGSADVLLRSELSPLFYQEGSIGMASAGKDTESTQFFITHVPTPHLNGKYTLFGKVISGISVVHSLTVGDTIIKIELKK
ncbi:MAG: peptidylprolyl isomerase [Bacteroidia bacterium]|nr:peptidylprolyl isomerase [Bacteroidia bacterium]MDW8346177.1 peptidylprolyl isomerase [Bacteroidia bacterium]